MNSQKKINVEIYYELLNCAGLTHFAPKWLVEVSGESMEKLH